ncbi:hypothetical protein C8046_17540 [Serinibacter arcticus]|uniref:ATP synthase protein I2 n=1 Tax=Serinibacter arcticus TaxID=1655435 RepID=A0A2U1ZZ27_9MICO|nr:hypothetical protein [Serinibacter arcticus]PWD52172.1 hypothetical protein C8046_17540 [Serinibacter arcticus]
MTDSPAAPSSPAPSSPAPASPARSGPPTTLRAVLAGILRHVAVVTAAVTVLGAVVGLLTSGTPGLWGALLGGVVGIIFCLTTVVTMLVSEGRSPQFLAVAVLGGWLAKMIVIVALLMVLRGFDFYDRYVLAGTLGVIVIASLVVEMRAVTSARVPVVEPRAQDRHELS